MVRIKRGLHAALCRSRNLAPDRVTRSVSNSQNEAVEKGGSSRHCAAAAPRNGRDHHAAMSACDWKLLIRSGRPAQNVSVANHDARSSAQPFEFHICGIGLFLSSLLLAFTGVVCAFATHQHL